MEGHGDDREIDESLHDALTRLRAMGNPGLARIARPWWLRDHYGWPLTFADTQCVVLTAAGRLYKGDRALRRKSLTPQERAELLSALGRLGRGLDRH